MAVVAVFVHHDRHQAAALGADISRWLGGHGHEVRMPPKDAEMVGLSKFAVDEAAIGSGLELAVTLGGDGTMLRTIDLVARGGAAVLGVNVGQLGYLTEVDPADAISALERYFRGEHRIEDRMLVEATIEGDGRKSLALNEAVVERTPGSHTVRLKVSIDGEFFTTYVADGLIVSTPTGSTAYSFSARGPIVDPEHRAMVVTPVSPHMLFDRSLVLAPMATVRLEVMSQRSAVVEVDGQPFGELGEGDALVCTAAETTARFVRFGVHDFHRILKQKFGLSDRVPS